MRDFPSADAYRESNNGIYAILRKIMQLLYTTPLSSIFPILSSYIPPL